jgi:hypothetical protein
MAQTKQCSAKEILARVIRNTGNKIPSVYFDDILEWIPEAIDLLSNTKTLEINSTGSLGCADEEWVENHVICIPKDLVSIIAIEDENGRIIPEGSDITDLRSQTTRQHGTATDSRASVFSVNPLSHQTTDGTPTDSPGSTIPLYGSDLTAADNSATRPSYYKVSGNYIQFSFEEGFVKLHYLRRPLDNEGYPLIPDNENFKSACSWYVIAALIAAGFQHPVFSYEQAYEKFELFGGRAINEITYPSLDAMARINRATTRLIPPYHAYEDFFVNIEQTQQIRK